MPLCLWPIVIPHCSFFHKEAQYTSPILWIWAVWSLALTSILWQKLLIHCVTLKQSLERPSRFCLPLVRTWPRDYMWRIWFILSKDENLRSETYSSQAPHFTGSQLTHQPLDSLSSCYFVVILIKSIEMNGLFLNSILILYLSISHFWHLLMLPTHLSATIHRNHADPQNFKKMKCLSQ